VAVPRDNGETEALIVLTFEEASKSAPAPFDRRFPVRPATSEPLFELRCGLRDQVGERPKVAAGDTLHVRCEIGNVGAPATDVKLEVRVGGGAPQSTALFDLGTDEQTSETVAIDVPRDATLDAELEIGVVLVEARGKRTPLAEPLRIIVERAKICPDGKLTRAEFTKKRGELRKARDAGLITAPEYERYEAELVGCLE
jgi:hypothetical protein